MNAPKFEHGPAKIISMILQGWTTAIEELQPYQQRKDQLSVHDGCVLLGNRVVVSGARQLKVMEELHQGHPGITRMKGVARSFVWWSGMDKQKKRLDHVQTVNKTRIHLLWPLYTHGNGLSVLGLDYIYITMQALFWVRCF